MPKEIKVFEIKDLGLASALSAKGFQIIKTEMKKDRVVYFIFQSDPEIEESAQNYFLGNFMVDAIQLSSEMKRLRKIIGAHFNAEAGEKKMTERKIQHKYDDEIAEEEKEDNKKKKKKTNDGFEPL